MISGWYRRVFGGWLGVQGVTCDFRLVQEGVCLVRLGWE